MQNDKHISRFFSLNCARDVIPFFIGCKRRVEEHFGSGITELVGESQLEAPGFIRGSNHEIGYIVELET